jgi:cysteine synthase
VLKRGAAGVKDHRHRTGRRIAAQGRHEWKPHKIQGWTPDFVPEVLNRDVRPDLVAGHRRRRHRHRAPAGAEEGIFVGISAGATLAAR